MSPLGKKIVVYGMFWVLLVMVVSQIYDNVRGKGMPPQAAGVPTIEPTPQADPDVARLADLQNCVASDPSNLQCALDLADLYYAARQYPQAQVNYERAVKLDPHNVQPLFRLAGTYIYQQKFEQAVPTLQQAATISPNSPEIHLLLGLSLSKLNPARLEEAVREWRTVIQLDPESAWAKQAAEYINTSGK
ncbi:MAG TPA: tetratricopeptide repeat protein [Chloroflexia bacterium]|nr:tetratricopeptide repeat protein [Chloroflexia bacterium]